MRTQLLIAAVAASQLGATDCGQVIRDPGFDLWCGDKLCTWKVVRGDVKRVDTWHEGDSGVELVGDDAAIAQLSPVNHHDGTCIQFDFVANVDEDAEAFLNIDVYGDGSIERPERIGTSKWKPFSYKLRIAKPFTGIRFELAKRGRGRAAFAQVGARIADGCEGLTEVTQGPAPNGAYCTDDASCKSGMCRTAWAPGSLLGIAMLCASCDPRSPACDAGEVCGIGEPTSPALAVQTTCVAAGGDELGEQCGNDAECASGKCVLYACSTCNPYVTTPCAGGETCGQAWENGPWVCSPNGGLRAAFEPCTADADCASGRCNGAVREACSDNRPCGNDSNCPVEDGLEPGTCSVVGIQGGRCE